MVYVDKEADEKKTNLTPFAIYFKDKKKIAVQYKVEAGSRQQKNLWEKLNFTSKNEYKVKTPRKRKV